MGMTAMVSFASQLSQKLNPRSAAFIAQRMLFEPQNISFLELDLLSASNQPIGD
jgi:hypothetical protein